MSWQFTTGLLLAIFTYLKHRQDIKIQTLFRQRDIVRVEEASWEHENGFSQSCENETTKKSMKI